MMELEILEEVRKLEKVLSYGKFNDWLEKEKNKLSQEDKEKVGMLRTQVRTYKSRIEDKRLQDLIDKLEKLEEEMKEGMDELDKEIGKMGDFARAMELLDKVVGVICKIVGLLGA